MLDRAGLAAFLLALALAVPSGVASAQALTNDDCLACHAGAGLTRADGSPVAVNPEKYAASIHAGFGCVDCHLDLADAVELPHAETLASVPCAMCHDEPVAAFERGIHAEARSDDPNGPAASCVDCHGTHDILPSSDSASRTYHLTLPDTCGHCHGSSEIIERGHIEIGDVMSLYVDSIHGRALTRSGLLVAPNCADCHGSHDVRRLKDPESLVYRTNVPETCGSCHAGVLHEFGESVHGAAVGAGNLTAPTCQDCHTAHAIQRADTETWRLDAIRECGTCHSESIRTYRDTFHGQVTALGFARVATCSDCHTSRRIFPVSDERSSVGPTHLVSTCQTCHPGANENFVEFDPHADKENLARDPFLYYTGKFMKNLLLFVFGFFGLHTGLWFMGEVRERRLAMRRKLLGPTNPARSMSGHLLRFDRYQRLLHGFLMLSFLGLAGTGLPLLFSENDWAHIVARLWGGFVVAGLLHRFFAVILIGVFVLHVWGLLRRILVQKELSVLWGPASMVAQPRDVVEMYRHFLWFFGVGPRPRFDHFTYWEKFDYWAVFWGMGIIGGSGFLLWFPEFFASFLPGWMFNIAMLVHGEEALLAVGFIFTIHFFNGHLRPDKYPMDLVIFTGRVEAGEFAHERPAEHERLVAEGRLDACLASPPSATLARAGRLVGTAAVTVGLAIVCLILYAVFL